MCLAHSFLECEMLSGGGASSDDVDGGDGAAA